MIKLLEKYILNKYNYISFDIFDTLIERDVNDPRDIFEIIEKELGEKDFRKIRIEAEKKARLKKESGEVILDEIYDEIKDTVIDKEIIKEYEVKIELKHIEPKYNMVCFLNRCIVQKKDIYLISDMYLSESIIRQFLDKCGIHRYNKLYLSNKYDVNKISGKLFHAFLKDENIDCKKVIHIGDSIRADLLGAQKVKIKAILINRKNRFKRVINTICQQKY